MILVMDKKFSCAIGRASEGGGRLPKLLDVTCFAFAFPDFLYDSDFVFRAGCGIEALDMWITKRALLSFHFVEVVLKQSCWRYGQGSSVVRPYVRSTQPPTVSHGMTRNRQRYHPSVLSNQASIPS